MNAVVSARRVPVIAITLLVVALAVRAVPAFGGYFYWDDLILIGRAGTQNLLSWGYLFDDHDGHVMPAGFLLGGLITRAAPLVWFWPALSLVVLQLLAWLALLRTLHVILGWRPVLLAPWTFALFTPLGLPGFAWWAAGLNSLPMSRAAPPADAVYSSALPGAPCAVSAPIAKPYLIICEPTSPIQVCIAAVPALQANSKSAAVRSGAARIACATIVAVGLTE